MLFYPAPWCPGSQPEGGPLGSHGSISLLRNTHYQRSQPARHSGGITAPVTVSAPGAGMAPSVLTAVANRFFSY